MMIEEGTNVGILVLVNTLTKSQLHAVILICT